MKTSPLQDAILNAYTTTQDNLIIQARAGSGKTTMLCQLANAHTTAYPNQSCIFLAFNKSIATELESRLPPRAPAKTFHSLGFSELRQRMRSLKSEPKKVMSIIEVLAPDLLYDDRYSIARLVSYAKNSGVGLPPENVVGFQPRSNTPAVFMELADTHNIDESETLDLSRMCQLASKALDASNLEQAIIDFDDMIYLPILRKLHLTKYDVVFVDEAQDISALQREFIRKIARRVVVVGDNRQAIYAFRGADSSSMGCFKEEFKCVELPLSITYRCPTKVVDMARNYVPDFSAREDAPPGEVNYVALPQVVWESIPSGAMLICRNNKPLFDIVMRFLKIRKPFNVKGDFSSDLKRFIKGRKATSLKQLRVRLDTWADKEIQKAEAKKAFSKVEQIIDKRDVLQDMIDTLIADGQTAISALSEMLDRITNSEGGVTITTIHKAKGLEAEHVYFLRPDLLPSRYAVSDGEILQEDNLYYVGITRTKSTLTFLTKE